MYKELMEFKRERNLVSIRRKGIDENKIQAFILECSKELVLIQYVYDFTIDGLMLLRLSDITEISSNKTDKLQTKILKDDGLYQTIEFNQKYDISNWKSALSALKADYEFATIEEEHPDYPLFHLGKILKLGSESLKVKCFSGAANWMI